MQTEISFEISNLWDFWELKCFEILQFEIKKKIAFQEIFEKYFRPFCNNLQFAIRNAEIILNFKLAFFEKLVQF